MQPEISQYRRVNTVCSSVVLPDGKARLQINAPHPVERRHIKASRGLVIARRIACRRDHPPLRQRMDAEGLVLQHLQNRGHERLGDAVDLVEEQDSRLQSGFLHLFVDRGNDLAHGVLRRTVLPPSRRTVNNDWQAERALARVVRHGIADEADMLLLRKLRQDGRFADTRRAHEQNGPLLFARYAPQAVLRSGRIGADGLPQLLFCLFYIHASSPFGLSASKTSFSAHGGRSISSYRYCSMTKIARYAGGASGNTP